MAKDTTAADAKKAAADKAAAEAKAKADKAKAEADKLIAKNKADADKAAAKAVEDAKKLAAKAEKDAAKAKEKADEQAKKDAEKAQKAAERDAKKAQKAAEREARKSEPRPPKPWEDLPAGAEQQAPREPSVLHTVLEMIAKNKGATLDELQAAVGEKHPIRALLRWANRERGYGFVMTKSTQKIMALAPNLRVAKVAAAAAPAGN